MFTLHNVSYAATNQFAALWPPPAEADRPLSGGVVRDPDIRQPAADRAGARSPGARRARRPRHRRLPAVAVRVGAIDPRAGRIQPAPAPGRVGLRVRGHGSAVAVGRLPAKGRFRRGRALQRRVAGHGGVMDHLARGDVAVLPMKNRLRVLRAEYNWSQMELGMRVGVSRQAINAIETGKYDPSLPLAMKIARLFGQTVEEIFQLEETE